MEPSAKGEHAVFTETTTAIQPVPLRTSYLVIALGFGAIAFEGYDLIVYGAAVPALLAYPGWVLTPAKVGLMGGAAFLGMFLGAPAAGWLSDRFGRRRLFIGLLAFFSLMMLLVSVAPNPLLFGLFRFLAGLAFGGIPPTAIAQAFEFSPPHRRVLFNSIMLSGFGIGAILAGVLALTMLKSVGFRGLFAFGCLPLVTLAPLAWFTLPESPNFRGRGAERAPYTSTESSWVGVLRGRAGLATAMFGLANFCSLQFSFALNTWLPQLMRGAGYPLGSALQLLLLLNVGALCGVLLFAWLAERIGVRVVAPLMFVIAALALGLLGLHVSGVAVHVLVFIIGASGLGSQSLLFSFMGTVYRRQSRATAVGAISSIGHLGAATGPVVGALMVSAHLGLARSLLILAAIAVVSATASLLVPRGIAESASAPFPQGGSNPEFVPGS